MPRKPLGTYTRDTAWWFQHKRARIGGLAQVITNNPVAIGLKNNDQGGRVCHLLGVTISIYQTSPLLEPAALSGGYYDVPGAALAGGDIFTPSDTEPFFDLDPIPMVALDAWYNFNNFPGTATLIPVAPATFTPTALGANQQNAAALVFYPPGGLAAFKPGRGYFILNPITDAQQYAVGFDFVMLTD